MRKILLIDTDRDFVYVTSTLLKNHNFNVIAISEKTSVPAVDTMEVLEVVHCIEPDYIFLSYDFFEKQIVEICRKIRAVFRGTIILLTKHGNIRVKLEDCLANMCLCKPFNSQALLNIVKS